MHVVHNQLLLIPLQHFFICHHQAKKSCHLKIKKTCSLPAFLLATMIRQVRQDQNAALLGQQMLTQKKTEAFITM